MKKVIRASRREGQLPITELTEDEIAGLPEKVVLVTRRPGASTHSPLFTLTSKDVLYNPEEFLDSYWGHDYSSDTYLASKAEVEEYYNKEIARIEAKKNKYKQFAL